MRPSQLLPPVMLRLAVQLAATQLREAEELLQPVVAVAAGVAGGSRSLACSRSGCIRVLEEGRSALPGAPLPLPDGRLAGVADRARWFRLFFVPLIQSIPYH